MNNDEILDHNARNIAEFRASGGEIAAFGDAPLLLLTTRGARSGEPRTSPMMYLPDEHDRNVVYVFASYAGADVHPAWYHNLVAHPGDLDVEIARQHLKGKATVLAEPQRTRTFDEQAALYPGFAGYQARTQRTIPVIALELQETPADVSTT